VTHPADRLIREIPDFPKPGIRFKDLTPLFGDGDVFERAMADLEARIDWTGVTRIAAIEARGFVIGGYLAARRRMGFIPIRKPGKLPARTIAETYELEYGHDTLEMHADACEGRPGVLVVDDVLATGGTASAAARLVERAGGEVRGFAFLLELSFLSGRDRLPDRPLVTLLTADD
jgi:adenine phosphoribosyltransferase